MGMSVEEALQESMRLLLTNDKTIKEELEKSIKSIETSGGVDLTKYSTTEEMKEYVDDAVKNVDTIGFVTDETLSTTLSDYAKTEDIPDTNGLATETFVENIISERCVSEVISNSEPTTQEIGNYWITEY